MPKTLIVLINNLRRSYYVKKLSDFKNRITGQNRSLACKDLIFAIRLILQGIKNLKMLKNLRCSIPRIEDSRCSKTFGFWRSKSKISR